MIVCASKMCLCQDVFEALGKWPDWLAIPAIEYDLYELFYPLPRSLTWGLG